MDFELDIMTIILGVGALAITALIVVDVTNNWMALESWLGWRKKKAQTAMGKTESPKGLKIAIDSPKHGRRIIFHGKEDRPEDKVIIFDEAGHPVDEFDYNTLRLTNVRSVLEGNISSMIFRVEDNTYLSKLQNEIQARDMHIVELQKTIKDLQKSYKEIAVGHAKAEQQVQKTRYAGIRPVYVKDRDKRSSSEPVMPQDMGGGEEG